jgi:hypothetical protein
VRLRATYSVISPVGSSLAGAADLEPLLSLR